MARAKRWLRRGTFGVLILLLVYLAAYLGIAMVADARLEAELEAIRERGEPIALEQMAPAPVPDAENAALPLSKAFAMLQDETEEESEARDRLFEAPFAADDADAARVADWLERNASALNELEEALRRPECRFDLDYSSALDMEFPDFARLRDAGHLLVARSVLRAREGAIEDALTDCRGAFRVAELSAADPLAIIFLMRIAMERMGLDWLERLLVEHETSEAQRLHLIATLRRIDMRRVFRRMLIGERCFGISAFETVHGGTKASDVLGADESGDPFPLCMISDPVYRLDEARYLKLMARGIERADRPFHESRAGWESLRVECTDGPWYALLSPVALIILPHLAEQSEAHRARVDMALIALGDDAGSADPFTGEPYEVLEQSDGTKVLRSPGPDVQDEADDITWRIRPARGG